MLRRDQAVAGHLVVKRLSRKLQVRGDLADIALVAYTRVAHEGGFDLSIYPAVKAWVGRIETALGII